jgi:hypothetical protein
MYGVKDGVLLGRLLRFQLYIQLLIRNVNKLVKWITENCVEGFIAICQPISKKILVGVYSGDAFKITCIYMVNFTEQNIAFLSFTYI